MQRAHLSGIFDFDEYFIGPRGGDRLGLHRTGHVLIPLAQFEVGHRDGLQLTDPSFWTTARMDLDSVDILDMSPKIEIDRSEGDGSWMYRCIIWVSLTEQRPNYRDTSTGYVIGHF